MRVRLFALLSVVALFVLAAVPASATSEGHSYLALGDSVPFGFNPNPALWSNASNFVGYPEIVAHRLNIEDVNATCPGEATGGFISLTGTDNLCRPYRFVLHEPLHVSYSGTQLAFATSYLTTHPRTRLVTLTLGANDVFHLQHVCEAAHKGDPVAIGKCFVDGIPAVLFTMATNLNAILGTIRATGYSGLIVAVTYYSLDYRDTSGAELLNGPMIATAKAHGALVADGVAAWAPVAAGGSSCAAGLLLPPFPPDPAPCDVHPTPLGRDLLAGAVVKAIADSCPAASAIGCLNRSQA
jgi:lysophospholipase L1-like esterase